MKILSSLRLQSRKNFSLVLGFAALGIVALVPNPEGLSYDGQLMIGIFIMAAILWVSEAIPLPATALLLIMIQPLLGILSSDEVFAAFGNHAVFFLIGAFIIAAALEFHNLHRRLALYFLQLFENDPERFLLGIILTGALISFIIPNHAVVVLLLPIILLILKETGLIPQESNFGKASVIAIAFGCSIGSLATPIGGARNPLAIAFLNETAGEEISFVEWMSYSLPIVLVSLGITWYLIKHVFPPEENLSLKATRKLIKDEIVNLGPTKSQDKIVMGIIGITVGLWVFASGFINLAVIALIGSILLFVTGSITWEKVEDSMPWGIILLYGGAITLGVGMEKTGAAAWIAGGMVDVVGENPYIILLMLITVTILITNLISNTASVAMLLPIGYGLSGEVAELTPLATTLAIAFSGGLAFMLVIATPGNVITYSSGYFSTKDLFRAGVRVNIACIAVIFLISITYWRWLGVW